MFPKPQADLKSNTPEFEVTPLAKATGFREYDARWLFPQDVNLMGIQALGMGIGTQMQRLGVPFAIVPSVKVSIGYWATVPSASAALA